MRTLQRSCCLIVKHQEIVNYIKIMLSLYCGQKVVNNQAYQEN